MPLALARTLRMLTALAAVAPLGTSAACTPDLFKLSPELYALVAGFGFENVLLPVLIEMFVDAADPTKADLDGAIAQATSPTDRVARVHNELRREATAVQTRVPCGGQSIRQQLVTATTAGLAANWLDLWLTDALVADAKPALLRDLTCRADVGWIALTQSRPVTTVAPADVTTAWNISRIGAPGVWAAGYRGAGAIVGVIDTGVNGGHKDLKSQCSGGGQDGQSCIGVGKAAACTQGGGRCVGPLISSATGQSYWKDVTRTPAATPIDDHGHGTVMLGVAVGRNGVGVAPDANWIACRAMVRSPQDGQPSLDRDFRQLTECAQFLINPDNLPSLDPATAQNAATVILLPYAFGPPLDTADACDALLDFHGMVANIRAHGIVPVFPVGDDGTAGVPSPANYRVALAVGMTRDTETCTASPTEDCDGNPVTPSDSNRLYDPSSNHGTILCLESGPTGAVTSTRDAPSLLAPGKGVRAPWRFTDLDADGILDPGEPVDTYETLSGSAVAAAHVAGAVALLRGANAEFSFGASPPLLDSRFFVVDELLKRTAQDYRPSPFRAGRLDLVAAVSEQADVVAVSAPFPSPSYTDQSVAIAVQMYNWSAHTWTQAAGYQLSSINPADNTNWGFSRVRLPGTTPVVKPGELVTFDEKSDGTPPLLATARHQPGAYSFQWQMLHEGVPAPHFGALAQRPEGSNVVVIGTDLAYPAIFPDPATLAPGQCANINVRMTNNGTAIWTPGVYHLAETDGRGWQAGGIADLTRNVCPADGVFSSAECPEPAYYDFVIPNVCAPTYTGTWPFEFQMRHGTILFGAKAQSQLVVAPVDDAAFVSWPPFAPGYSPDPSFFSDGTAPQALTVRMRNTGTTIWDGSYCIALVPGTVWGATSTACIDRAVYPGTTFDFTLNVVNPLNRPGRFEFKCRLARNGSPFGQESPELWIRVDFHTTILTGITWLPGQQGNTSGPYLFYRYFTGSAWKLMTWTGDQWAGTRSEQTIGFTPNAAVIHPGPTNQTSGVQYGSAVFWKSPVSQPVSFVVNVKDIDCTGGDGVEFVFRQVSASGSVLYYLTHDFANCGTEWWFADGLTVAVNDTLRFIVKPKSNNNYDSTSVYSGILAIVPDGVYGDLPLAPIEVNDTE